jgi:hypothetical protein
MPDREFWLAIRQALLMIVSAIERYKLPDVRRTNEKRNG